MSSGDVTLVLIPSAAIGNAFAVLSNPEKRLRYDELGSDHEHVSTGQARHYNYYTEFEADITPEEIFNVFFGGHFPTGQYLSAVVSSGLPNPEGTAGAGTKQGQAGFWERFLPSPRGCWALPGLPREWAQSLGCQNSRKVWTAPQGCLGVGVWAGSGTG